MNLTVLRAGIKSHSDYVPTNQIYDNELDAYINQAYWYIWTLKRWTFSNKLKTFRFFPDISSAREGGTTCAIVKYTREVIFSAPVYPLDAFYEWEGQVIELEGVEYETLKIYDNQKLYLTTPYRGDSQNTYDGWTIKHKFYYLPENCLELLYLGHRDAPVPGSGQMTKGKQIHVSNLADEAYNLREDRTASSADWYIPLAPINIPPGEKIGLTYTQVADSTASIVGAYFVELCWAFEAKGGRVGPLSNPEILETGPVEQGQAYTVKATFLSHDGQIIRAPAYVNTQDTFPNVWEGMRKRLYFNQNFDHVSGKRFGNPVWREVTKNQIPPTQYGHEPARANDVDADYTITDIQAMSAGNPRYIETDGQHFRIRPYPRIDSYDYYYEFDDSGTPIVPEDYALWGEMRYIYKPHQLATATDSPEIPYEFHDLVLWTTLIDVYRKHGDLQTADMYERRIEKRIKGLERRYTGYVDQILAKGRFHVGQGGRRLDGSVIWHNGKRVF